MTTLRFTIPGKPQPKQRPRMGKGRVYTPKATRDYEAHVKRTAALAMADMMCVDGIWDLTAECEVTLRVYFPDRRTRDLDNACKSILDGLEGVLWDNDRRVCRITLVRELDREEPRVEVEVRQ